MTKTSYVVALGSNRRHRQFGDPKRVVSAAIDMLAGTKGITIKAVAPILTTQAIGPAGRAFANGAVVLKSKLEPSHLLAALKDMERRFGRRNGRRWGPRVLDADIILWSEGIWCDRTLAVPHTAYRQRRFVLDPLVHIVPDWRDPLDNHTIRQTRARLIRRKPVDPRKSAP